jgi:hypothetical protein
MENYTLQLQQQVEELDKLIQETDTRLKTNTAFDYKRIRVSNRKNGFQYYEVDSNQKRIYIPKEKTAMVQASVQRDYDMAVRKALAEAQYNIKRFLAIYDIHSIENVYNHLCDARKVLVTPIIPTDEAYIQEWKKLHYGQQNDYPMTAYYVTDQGEQVRSKSEKILADLFLKHHIPYTYEPRILLKGGKSACPDFALLNLRTRKTIYWEHFGLASNEEYASKAICKLRFFEDCGFEIGKDILFSIESDSQPLNQKMIEEKIEKHLL